MPFFVFSIHSMRCRLRPLVHSHIDFHPNFICVSLVILSIRKNWNAKMSSTAKPKQTNAMFVDELNSQLNVSQPLPLSRYAAQTYDAVWAMALSLDGAEIKWKQWKQKNSSTIPQLDHFDYTRYDMALEFFHQFSRLNFLGVSVCTLFAQKPHVVHKASTTMASVQTCHSHIFL